MSNQVSDDQEIVDKYLKVLEDRILAPIKNTEVREYCTATLLLLYAAIDGLGKLLHPKRKARPQERILAFLDYMGGDYKVHKEKLLGLRHSLVHNALNVGSLLSNAEAGESLHLKPRKNGADDLIFVNTNVMYADFVNAFRRFQADIGTNQDLMRQAASRLKWVDPMQWDDPDVANPSPAPVEFE